MNTASLQVVQDEKLAQDLRLIAADFEILDFFHHFGSSCFAMSATLAHILTKRGYRARVQGCYGEIRKDNGIFYIGYQGFAHAGQKEGHAVCVVNEEYLLDFGLGTLKKYYAADFESALVSKIAGNADYLALVRLENGADMIWRTDWISPMVELELQSQVASVERILAVYEDFQKNRVAYLVRKMFSANHHLPTVNLALNLPLNFPLDSPLVLRQSKAA